MHMCVCVRVCVCVCVWGGGGGREARWEASHSRITNFDEISEMAHWKTQAISSLIRFDVRTKEGSLSVVLPHGKHIANGVR